MKVWLRHVLTHRRGWYDHCRYCDRRFMRLAVDELLRQEHRREVWLGVLRAGPSAPPPPSRRKRWSSSIRGRRAPDPDE